MSSAGNTRGLIEAPSFTIVRTVLQSLPRGIPAASLKHLGLEPGEPRGIMSSAGNTRGLIEALLRGKICWLKANVFRGEYPRPH